MAKKKQYKPSANPLHCPHCGANTTNSKGFCYACAEEPPKKKTIEGVGDPSVGWGYIHEAGIYEGVWHIVQGPTLTRCEIGFNDRSPGVHVDFTMPDEDKICKRCLSMTFLPDTGVGVGIWKQRHPNAFDFMWAGHKYHCDWFDQETRKRCIKWDFVFDGTRESIPCPDRHLKQDHRMSHICCVGYVRGRYSLTRNMKEEVRARRSRPRQEDTSRES